MIKPLQRMVGPYSTPIKVTPLSQMIPHRVSDDYSTGKAFNGIVPFSPDMLRLMEIEGDSYIVPKKQIHNLVSTIDVDDWSHLFKKLNLLLGNMMKLLSNIRKQEYYKITYLKLEEKEIQRRHNLIKEKLLDRSTEQEEVEAKTPMTDREKIEQLKKSLIAMGFIGAAAGIVTDIAPLTGDVAEKSAQLAKKLMTDLGLTDFQAAGIVGNLLAEGFGAGKPNIIQGGSEGPPPPYGTRSVGYGWAQWTNGGNNGPEDRLNKFIIRLGGGPDKIGRQATDSDNYAYLLDDFRTGYSSVITVLKATTNATDAARIILTKYERPLNQSESVVRQRAANSNSVLQQMKKAAGGIVIPELFDRHRIEYDTERKSTLLSNFIVDKPTIINTKDVGEPLVIIPLGRPIGRSILKILFERPFKMIEKAFGQTQEQERSEVNPQTPIQNSQTQINRTSIPESATETGTTIPPSYSASIESKNSIVSIPKEILSSETSSTIVSIPKEILSLKTSSPIVSLLKEILSSETSSTIVSIPKEILSSKSKNSIVSIPKEILSSKTSSAIDMNIISKIISNISPILEKTMQQKTRIDNISQSVSDIFETEVFLLTQDITIIEE